MRRKDREITDMSIIKKMLAQAQVCRVGMVSSQGELYVAPLCPGYCEKEHVLYFHGAVGGQKHTILRENPKTCFEIEEGVQLQREGPPCNWGMNYRSLIGHGRVVFMDTPEGKNKGLNAVVTQYAGKPTKHIFPPKALGEVDVFKIIIEKITGKQCP